MTYLESLPRVARGASPPDFDVALLAAPRDWADDDLTRLAEWVRGGRTLVITDPPAEPSWSELTGADRDGNAGESVAEMVIEPTDHPASWNLPASVLVAPLTALRPHDGVATILSTRVHLRALAAVVERPLGRGRVITAAVGVELDRDGIVATAIRRAIAGVSYMAEIGVGIIGYGQHGGMGWLHGRAASMVAGLTLAAIAEVSAERLKDAGARFSEAELYEDPADLLRDDGVGAVVIATPPPTHHLLALQALRTGKHVVVEKPLCFTAAQADELLGAAADAGRTLTVHQNRRWDADFVAIRRLIDSGRLGEVFNVETFVGGFEHPCQLWHSDREVSGGRLYDWGAHLIDQTLRLLGVDRPSQVMATGHKRVWHDVTNRDQMRVRMAFEDGREAEFLDSDVLAVRRPKYLVQGTRGTLVGHYAPVVEEQVTPDSGYQRTQHHHAEGPARLTFAEHHTDWGLHETTIPAATMAPFPFHRALAAHLQLGDPVPVDPVEIREVTAVLEAATISADRGGAPVRPA